MSSLDFVTSAGVSVICVSCRRSAASVIFYLFALVAAPLDLMFRFPGNSIDNVKAAQFMRAFRLLVHSEECRDDVCVALHHKA